MTVEIPRFKTPELVVRSLNNSWTYERWLDLPDDGNRYEVIDGVLYMTTAPSFFHQWIIRQIVRELLKQIDDTGLGITIWSPVGLLMPGCEPAQPDILVVRTEEQAIIHDRRIHGVPALIVEVLSPGNIEKDMDIKRAAYARAGVPEYWIVRPAERDVIVLTHVDQTAGTYLHMTTFSQGDELVSLPLRFRAYVGALFAGSPDETL